MNVVMIYIYLLMKDIVNHVDPKKMDVLYVRIMMSKPFAINVHMGMAYFLMVLVLNAQIILEKDVLAVQCPHLILNCIALVVLRVILLEMMGNVNIVLMMQI